MPEPARLVVRRNSARDVKMREVHVYVDGELRGKLLYDGTDEWDIEPGEHRLRFDNTWKSTEKLVDFEPGQTRAYQVGNVPGGCFVLGLVLAGAAPTNVFVEEVDT